MQQITLVSMSLMHFKGIRQLEVEFGKVTNIFGRNASGKTTLKDAALWCLFGKDSTDRKDFEIKTLDENNKPYPRLSHEVKMVLSVDGELISLKRVYSEKWTRKHGSSKEEFTGHTNEFYWNDVPFNATEYAAKVSQLIVESQFKLLANLNYFNEVLKWQDRRSLLMQLAGGQTDLELAIELNKDKRYDHLIKALQQKKSLEEYRKELVSKKNKIKDQIKALPDRIDEAQRSVPPAADYDAIESQITALNESLQTVEQMISSQSAAEKERQAHITSLVQQKGQNDRTIMQLEYESMDKAKADRADRESSIANKRHELRAKEDVKVRLLGEYNTLAKSVDAARSRIASLDAEVQASRTAWETENAREFTFDPRQCACPTCKQTLPDMDVVAREAELRGNFNAEKSANLERIREKGAALAEQLKAENDAVKVNELDLSNIKARGQEAADQIEIMRKELQVLEEDHTRKSADESSIAKASFENDPRVILLRDANRQLDEQINAPATDDKSELLQRRRDLQSEIDALRIQHSKKDLTKQIEERIAELMKLESESANAIAELEGMEFDLLEFDKQKMELVERKINGLFRLVSFKLFDQQINGGVSPTCVALINGVPYTDANTASRIDASLDIIRVFSDYFGTKAPVFIDNRESVTDLIDTDLQIINLIVSPADRKLRVEASTEAAAAAY